MTRKAVSLITIFLLFVAIRSSAQGHLIDINIEGLSNKTVFLAYHLGDKQYLRDSILLDKNGHGKAEGKDPLPGGIYMIVLPGQSYFEVLIGSDQDFSIKCNINDPLNTLTFNGSEENQNFIDYQRGWVKLNEKGEGIRKRIEANRMNSDSLKVLQAQSANVDSEMKAFLDKVAKDNPGTLLSVLVKAMIPVEIPDFVSDGTSLSEDSLKWVHSYNFNRDHFFDNIDFNDERILRTPILHGKLNVYFRNLIIQLPDSLISATDKVLSLCEGNYKVFQYVSVYLFNHFRESEIMGHDAVLVHIADKVYLSGKADWVSKEFIADLRKQVDKLRPSLIGQKGADLVMDSYNKRFVSLYDVNKEFTILYFWEPDCGHCKEATPVLKAFYDRNKNKDIEVFAVCTQPDKEKWEKYILENGLDWINGWDPQRATNFDYYYNVTSTPLVYILNRRKEIIAKRLPVENIESFLESYRRYNTSH